MKKNLLTVALLGAGFLATAQNVLTSVADNGLMFVAPSTLVYVGGGLETKGNGVVDVGGNLMIVGTATDDIRTVNATTNTAKLDGGNIVVRLNDYANAATSTYGQIYINGFQQGKITGIVDKEYRSAKQGSYQQIAMPFYNKILSDLSGSASTIGTLGKTFSNQRYSQNEILIFNNRFIVSDNFNIYSPSLKSTAYYMVGSKNLNTGVPPATMPSNPTIPARPNGAVYTIKGVPYTNGITEVLNDAALGVQFGTGGSNRNSYNEKYNSYITDVWDMSTPWDNNFGRNIYEFGNPFLTNIDLSLIGITETGGVNGTSDGNAIPSIQGIRYNPGSVITTTAGTFSLAPQYVNFTSGVSPLAAGDVALIIKPMEVFEIKLRNNDAPIGLNRTLNFDTLRRFKYGSRAANEDYKVDAAKDGSAVTIKQLGVIGLDAEGNELARTYYAVYPYATTGYTLAPTVQSSLDTSNIMGTYEEDIAGGIDPNHMNSYWLYINEANETDFKGKEIPMSLFSTAIKSLKFEVRENAQLIADGAHDLSTGIGFYYRASNGTIQEVAQNQVIPVTSDKYGLFYGKTDLILGTGTDLKTSRTMVVYNKQNDKFVVRFDPSWKKSTINVFDMSGKIVISQKEVLTDKDFEINLSKMNAGYVVTAVSETGEKISSKIIR